MRHLKLQARTTHAQLQDGGLPNLLVHRPTQTTDSAAKRLQKGVPRQIRDAGPLESENHNLQEMALLELGLIDIQMIAEYHDYIYNQPVATPIPLILEPFWSEFNE